MTKINSFITAALIVASFVGGQVVERLCSNPSKDKLEAYADYYVCTEHLLDLIEKQYHWVDGIDHQGYYETRDEVVFLDWQGLDRAQKQFNKVLEWETKQNK